MTFNRRVNWSIDFESGIFQFRDGNYPNLFSSGSGLVIPSSAIATPFANVGDVIGFSTADFTAIAAVTPPSVVNWQGAVICTA